MGINKFKMEHTLYFDDSWDGRRTLGPIEVPLSTLTEPEEPPQECDIIGLFGIIVQALLAAICIGSLVIKKFMPGETRTWKVFCLDIWKQLLTAGFAHILNVTLAI